MIVETYSGGWIQHGSIIVFPHEWQKPVITEEWVYKTLLENKVNSCYVEFIAFPWATLIDLISRKKNERVNLLLEALRNLPPKKSILRITAIQHINILPILGLLNRIGVTDLFWAHKTRSQHNINEIRIHPMALYPFAFFDNQEFTFKNPKDRFYKYSFIGAYDETLYISNIRKIIFELSQKDNSLILRRDKWHFETSVYDFQIEGKAITDDDLKVERLNFKQYVDVLSNTQFSLCPSGSGPNSIRLWESIAYGCIPVLLSDSLELPQNISNNYVYKVSESDIYQFVKKIQSPIAEPIPIKIIEFNKISNIFLCNLLEMFTNSKIIEITKIVI
jgi:hypothetical protein